MYVGRRYTYSFYLCCGFGLLLFLIFCPHNFENLMSFGRLEFSISIRFSAKIFNFFFFCEDSFQICLNFSRYSCPERPSSIVNLMFDKEKFEQFAEA